MRIEPRRGRIRPSAPARCSGNRPSENGGKRGSPVPKGAVDAAQMTVARRRFHSGVVTAVNRRIGKRGSQSSSAPLSRIAARTLFRGLPLGILKFPRVREHCSDGGLDATAAPCDRSQHQKAGPVRTAPGPPGKSVRIDLSPAPVLPALRRCRQRDRRHRQPRRSNSCPKCRKTTERSVASQGNLTRDPPSPGEQGTPALGLPGLPGTTAGAGGLALRIHP